MDPHIFANPVPGSQNLADPTDPGPKHCDYNEVGFFYTLYALFILGTLRDIRDEERMDKGYTKYIYSKTILTPTYFLSKCVGKKILKEKKDISNIYAFRLSVLDTSLSSRGIIFSLSPLKGY